MKKLQAVLIAGPTASGKSGLAVEIAKSVNGCVVNTDSMQVYDVLSVLTARPQPHEMDGVDHFLYGHVPPSKAYSVAQYLADVKPVLGDVLDEGRVPVFTGGTGLYFKGLLEGLSAIPPINPEIRAEIRGRSANDLEGLYEELSALDPDGAGKLKPGDSQRICRALEVVRSTGKPLLSWQNTSTQAGLLDSKKCLKIILMPKRPLLRERIAKRFAQMAEDGALEEVRRLMQLALPDDLPAMRAIGVQQLASYLKGDLSLDQAIDFAVTATHQYAKRQSTWFRNQFMALEHSHDSQSWRHFESGEEALESIRSTDLSR